MLSVIAGFVLQKCAGEATLDLMKRYLLVLIVGTYIMMVLLAFSSNWFDCSEYAAFSSKTCRDINRWLGIDLYWVSVSSAMLLIPLSILIAPLLMWVFWRAVLGRRAGT